MSFQRPIDHEPPVQRRSALSEYAKADHKRVAKALGCVLVDGSQQAWWALPPILAARLTREERASLAFMALNALSDADARNVVEQVFVHSGEPEPFLGHPLEEAAWWVERATEEELGAYAVACFRAMSPSRQQAFLQFCGGSA